MMPSPPAAERDTERVDRIAQALRKAELSALVCGLPSNVLLLTGYWPVVGTSIAVATQEGAIGLLVPSDEADLAGAGWADATVRFTPSSLHDLTPLMEVVAPALAEVLRRLGGGGGRIGFERGPMLEPSSYAGSNRYAATLRDLLTGCCPAAAVLGADEVLADLRSVLTPREIAQVRTACGVAENAFRVGAGSLVPGATEREVAAAFRGRLMAHADSYDEGSARAGGFMFCMSGPHAALASRAYARTRGRRIEPGDPVMVHCNSFVNGFWTDITRTYLPHPDDHAAQAIFHAVLEARDAAMYAIVPGVRAQAVDQAARRVIERRGFGSHFLHGTGHGVGFAAIDPNARPRLHPASEDVLEVGMVFNVEPAVYVQGWGGVRQCELVRVGVHGAELLTSFHSRLEDLAPRLGAARAGR